MKQLVWCLVAAGVLAACGASSKQVAMAKSARYRGDQIAIFGGVREVVKSKYSIQQSDETTLSVRTEPRWYSWEGVALTVRYDFVTDLKDNAINISYLVTMVPDGDAHLVRIKPNMLMFQRGSPQPQPLSENDANVPGWVHSAVDELALAIHKALEPYEVKSASGPPGGGGPPGEGAPPPPPDEPPPPPPADEPAPEAP
jgi:hypothetical protein